VSLGAVAVVEVSVDAEPVAGVAAQLLDVEPELFVVTVLPAARSGLTVLVLLSSVDVAVDTAASVDCSAITLPRLTSVATLAPAATLRARAAGCGRFLRGVVSGISRSLRVEVDAADQVPIVRDGGKRSMRRHANGG
jgi:hypothetical protein